MLQNRNEEFLLNTPAQSQISRLLLNWSFSSSSLFTRLPGTLLVSQRLMDGMGSRPAQIIYVHFYSFAVLILIKFYTEVKFFFDTECGCFEHSAQLLLFEGRNYWPFCGRAKRSRTVVQTPVAVLCLQWTLPSWAGCIMSCICAWLLQSKIVYLNSHSVVSGIVNQGFTLGGAIWQ